MKKALWEIFKTTVIMFTVGALLGAAAPHLATLIDMGADKVAEIAAHNTPLWMGMFFGAFGAINAAVTPLENYCFGKVEKKRHLVKNVAPEKSAGKEQQPVVVVVQNQAQGLDPQSMNFRATLEAERNKPADPNISLS